MNHISPGQDLCYKFILTLISKIIFSQVSRGMRHLQPSKDSPEEDNKIKKKRKKK